MELEISALVRSDSQAAVIDGLHGVCSITVNDFDQLDRLEELGEQFDSMSFPTVKITSFFG